MATQFLELKPDRSLLFSDFEGYKLSLKPTNVIRHELESPINRILAGSNQYSFLHAKIFGLYNFLVGETCGTYENVYFFNQDRHLNKASLNPYTNTLDISQVWSVPTNETASINDKYNVSLRLVSESLAVLSDGMGAFFILDTGDRSTDCEWQIIFSKQLFESKSFYIQDAVLKETELHIILCMIEQGDKKTQLVIHWISFVNKTNSWEQLSSRELLVKGDIKYLYLEKTCEAIYVASSTGCKFTFDSEKIILDESENIKTSILDIPATEKNYKWSQDLDDVVIHFIMPEDIQKEELVVTCGRTNIQVKYKDLSLLNGTLFGKVNSDMTAFTVSKNLLEINLVKEDQGLTWTSFLQDNGENLSSDESYCGSEIKDPLKHLTSEKEEVPQQGITFNTEEIEECDFSNSDFTIFERLCVNTHKVTHKYNLGSNDVLLTVQMNNDLPPCLGVRQDVDVCLWQPCFKDGNFELNHVATLLAFGYIQASKQQKKFMACPTDTSYSVICESSRHMFLYRQKSSVTSGELRNRKFGTRIESVAEQQVISIPNEEIFGIYVSPTAIYVVGESFLMHIKI